MQIEMRSHQVIQFEEKCGPGDMIWDSSYYQSLKKKKTCDPMRAPV